MSETSDEETLAFFESLVDEHGSEVGSMLSFNTPITLSFNPHVDHLIPATQHHDHFHPTVICFQNMTT